MKLFKALFKHNDKVRRVCETCHKCIEKHSYGSRLFVSHTHFKIAKKKIQYSYRNVPETMTNRQQRRRHVIHGSLCVKPSCKKPRRAETIHLSIERISFFKIAH